MTANASQLPMTNALLDSSGARGRVEGHWRANDTKPTAPSSDRLPLRPIRRTIFPASHARLDRLRDAPLWRVMTVCPTSAPRSPLLLGGNAVCRAVDSKRPRCVPCRRRRRWRRSRRRRQAWRSSRSSSKVHLNADGAQPPALLPPGRWWSPKEACRLDHRPEPGEQRTRCDSGALPADREVHLVRDGRGQTSSGGEEKEEARHQAGFAEAGEGLSDEGRAKERRDNRKDGEPEDQRQDDTMRGARRCTNRAHDDCEDEERKGVRRRRPARRHADSTGELAESARQAAGWKMSIGLPDGSNKEGAVDRRGQH